MLKSNDTSTGLTFKTGKVIFRINKCEYEFVRGLVAKDFAKAKEQNKVINSFLIIKLFQQLYRTNNLIAIHSSVFKESISSHNYCKHLDYLVLNGVVEYTGAKKETYKVDGRTKFKSSTKKYRTLTMAYSGTSNIFDDTYQEVEVTLGVSSEVYELLRTANNIIVKMDFNQRANKVRERLNDIAESNFHELQSSALLVKLIKDVYSGKINARTTWRRRINQIANEMLLASNNGVISKDKDSSGELKQLESSIELLAIKIIKNIYEIRSKNNKKIEQIVESFLTESNRNQIVTHDKKLTRQSNEMKLGFYTDLSIGVDGLDCCYCMADLKHIARLNQVPVFKEDGKLYSSLANLRRDIRKFVFFRGERLVEVSDIPSAHFTMLPRIFEKCDIKIDSLELCSYKWLTQGGDLYSTVARTSNFSRDEIKQSFQSFFSIKSETQYLHHSHKDVEQRKAICHYFKYVYPNIYQSLLNFHTSFDRSIKSYANEVESEIMNEICGRIMLENLHPFRIHDAIYMTASEYARSYVDIKDLAIFLINNPGSNPLF